MDDPVFLAGYREIVAKHFKILFGRDPLPHQPVGPHTMMDRNWANVEYSCTALYYVPAPEEDVILCSSDDGEHYRDKNTHEEIRRAWDDNTKYVDGVRSKDHSNWHEVQIVYDKDKRHEDPPTGTTAGSNSKIQCLEKGKFH